MLALALTFNTVFTLNTVVNSIAQLIHKLSVGHLEAHQRRWMQARVRLKWAFACLVIPLSLLTYVSSWVRN